ncbi:MAG: LacI family DNA-binding transcriptional regulator [Clostridiales bacterium]|nr:LacI family DNA-binding transcriptional regulator [Clostridiales bacterium]
MQKHPSRGDGRQKQHGRSHQKTVEYCGVSPLAISKALNNQADVSEETRRKVLTAAEKMGYRPMPLPGHPGPGAPSPWA